MTRLGLVLFAALLLAGCPGKKKEPVAPAAPATPPLVHDRATLSIAFVPLKASLLEAATTEAFAAFSAQRGCSAAVTTVQRADYPGLGDLSLEFSLSALDAPTRAAVQGAHDVVSVELEWPATEPRHLREAYEGIVGLAVAERAVIFDRHAVSAYSVEDYRARRLSEGWWGAMPVGPRHFMVHLVPQENGLLMFDTGGLNRFGLNDLTLLDVNRASVNAAGNLVNVVAQRLIEGDRPDGRGWLRVRLEHVQEPAMKKQLAEASFDNARGELVVAFGPPDVAHGARPEAIELSFPELACANRGECLDAALTRLFGAEDRVSTVVHDARVLEAKARAMADVMKYRAKVKKGLPANEVLLVKSRFGFDGGTEWMWVEVVTWTGNTITGRLENEPGFVALRAGATVEVKLEDVMDYEYRLKDRTFYGNETGRVLHPEVFEAVDGGRWRSRAK